MYFWKHLFDTMGFPISRVTYGHGWDKTLIVLAFSGEVLGGIGCFLLIVILALSWWTLRQQRFDLLAGEEHLPRLLAFYFVSVLFLFLMFASEARAFWYPFNRLVGLTTFLSGMSLFASGFKTIWAFRLCVLPRKAQAPGDYPDRPTL